MSRPTDRLSFADLELLHRALAYRRKRVREPAAQIRLQGLLARVEELLLARDGSPVDEPAGSGASTPSEREVPDRSAAPRLRFSPPEIDLLVREIPLYCAELTQRGGAEGSAEDARRLRGLLVSLQGGGPPWWRRLRRRLGGI